MKISLTDTIKTALSEQGLTTDDLLDAWNTDKVIFTSDGREIPDPRPIAVPAKFKQKLTLQDRINRIVIGRLSEIADEQDFDTFEEAMDFDVPDDLPEPSSPYEIMEDDYAPPQMPATQNTDSNADSNNTTPQQQEIHTPTDEPPVDEKPSTE